MQYLFRFNFNSNDLLSLLEQVDYIDSSIQTTSDTYKTGYGYFGFHNYSPDEIRADLDAYDLLLSLINSLKSTDNVSKMTDFIEERKIIRIRNAHQIDENGNMAVLLIEWLSLLKYIMMS